eukprot:12937049-Prorocentrum_lima.AAC.1
MHEGTGQTRTTWDYADDAASVIDVVKQEIVSLSDKDFLITVHVPEHITDKVSTRVLDEVESHDDCCQTRGHD